MVANFHTHIVVSLPTRAIENMQLHHILQTNQLQIETSSLLSCFDIPYQISLPGSAIEIVSAVNRLHTPHVCSTKTNLQQTPQAIPAFHSLVASDLYATVLPNSTLILKPRISCTESSPYPMTTIPLSLFQVHLWNYLGSWTRIYTSCHLDIKCYLT